MAGENRSCRGAVHALCWAFFLGLEVGCIEIVGDDDGPLPPALACDVESGEGVNQLGELSFDAGARLCLQLDMAPEDFEQLSRSNRFGGKDPFRKLIQQLTTDCTSPFPSQYPWYAANLGAGQTRLSNVGLRKKGFLGSVTGHGMLKPSLKIKTDKFVDGQALGSDERVTLNNNAQDATRVRTCLAYEIFAAASYPAPLCNVAGIMMNGEPLGAYAHVEPVKNRFLERQFGNDTGSLYEGTLVDFSPGFLSSELGSLGRWEAKTKDTDLSGTPLLELQAALGVPDDQLVASLETRLNLELFLRFWALEMLIDHRDGYSANRNNFFIYFDPGDAGRAVFLPWGADDVLADGQDDSSERVPEDYLFAELPRRLSRLPEIRQRFEEELEWLLDTVWDEQSLLARAKLYASLVEKLQQDDHYPTWIAQLEEWLIRRREQLGRLLEKGLPRGPDSPPSCFTIGLGDGLLAVQEAADAVGTYNYAW